MLVCYAVASCRWPWCNLSRGLLLGTRHARVHDAANIAHIQIPPPTSRAAWCWHCCCVSGPPHAAPGAGFAASPCCCSAAAHAVAAVPAWRCCACRLACRAPAGTLGCLMAEANSSASSFLRASSAAFFSCRQQQQQRQADDMDIVTDAGSHCHCCGRTQHCCMKQHNTPKHARLLGQLLACALLQHLYFAICLQ